MLVSQRQALRSLLSVERNMSNTDWKGRVSKLYDQIAGNVSHSHTLVVSEEVQAALQKHQPVVALESTIISHGMPYPQNFKTALEVEAVVRAHGAIPATVALLAGVPHVGLSEGQLHDIAQKGLKVQKTSKRDLAYVMTRKLDGSTTVSATMLLAARAGVSVFVTGGVGGVHRGGENSMDVSADLIELGKTSMAVVCAGIKSVLDIPRTLEFLETQGVCVAALGADEFPAFFTPHSGCRAPCRIDQPAEAAEMLQHCKALHLQSSILIGVPIPREHAAAGQQIEEAIQTALSETQQKNIIGSEITPYLLDRIQQLTEGASLTANIHLIKNNARVGSEIAVALSQRQQ